jgi:hypothetical protein
MALFRVCQCNLKHQLIKAGYNPDLVRILMDAIHASQTDWDELETHMQVEEAYIFPHLSAADRDPLVEAHSTLRSMRLAGNAIPHDLLDKHATTELGL